MTSRSSACCDLIPSFSCCKANTAFECNSYVDLVCVHLSCTRVISFASSLWIIIFFSSSFFAMSIWVWIPSISFLTPSWATLSSFCCFFTSSSSSNSIFNSSSFFFCSSFNLFFSWSLFSLNSSNSFLNDSKTLFSWRSWSFFAWISLSTNHRSLPIPPNPSVAFIICCKTILASSSSFFCWRLWDINWSIYHPHLPYLPTSCFISSSLFKHSSFLASWAWISFFSSPINEFASSRSFCFSSIFALNSRSTAFMALACCSWLCRTEWTLLYVFFKISSFEKSDVINSWRLRSTWATDSNCCVISFTWSVFAAIISFRREFSVLRVARDLMRVWRFSMFVRKKPIVRVICCKDNA